MSITRVKQVKMLQASTSYDLEKQVNKWMRDIEIKNWDLPIKEQIQIEDMEFKEVKEYRHTDGGPYRTYMCIIRYSQEMTVDRIKNDISS